MGKWFVLFLIAALLSTLVGMQAFLFGTKGLPFLRARGATLSAPAQPSAPADAKLVQPESLEQGFIVVVTDKSRGASASSPIHMPSSHNGWNPADPKMQLQAQSDGKWRIVWEKPKLDSRIAFKFARGSWENVEVSSDNKDVENRMLPMVDVSKLKSGEKPVIELEVAAWHDQIPGQAAGGGGQMERYRPIKVSAGTIQRVEVVGGAIPSMARDLIVWLPPGYNALENRSKSYPVLYLMDGQNVFEKAPASGASWDAAETAAKLIGAGKVEPLIIVAIPHAGAARSTEYLPFEMLDNVPARGGEFVSFLTGEVLPRIERNFRTKTGPENTGVGGASLGAIIALEAATRRPDVFSKVLCESMPLVHKDKAAFQYFGKAKSWPQKIAFGMGGQEAGTDAKQAAVNAQYTALSEAFRDLAKGRGLGEDRFRLTIDQAAQHNEQAWAKRFGPALEFLFPAAK